MAVSPDANASVSFIGESLTLPSNDRAIFSRFFRTIDDFNRLPNCNMPALAVAEDLVAKLEGVASNPRTEQVGAKMKFVNLPGAVGETHRCHDEAIYPSPGRNRPRSDEKAAETPLAPAAVTMNDFWNLSGRGEWIRTTDLLVPNQDDEENQ